MPRIRPYRPGDDAALSQVCLKTAASGNDATGLLSHDALWGDVLVLPYVAQNPELALVVESDDGRVTGYIVGTPDTRGFDAWFTEHWWPKRRHRYPAQAATETEATLLGYADNRLSWRFPIEEDYPAHLHIDLLPEARGAGLGRRLVEHLATQLTAAGASGIHALVSTDNHTALDFWPRVGFTPVWSTSGIQGFGRPVDRAPNTAIARPRSSD